MLTVAIANARSGVGKTTLTLGLAHAASRNDLRALVIDLDPQGHATAALSVTDPTWTTSDVLHAAAEGAATGAACSSSLPGVDLIAADLTLAEQDTNASLGSEFALRASLVGLTDYDMVLFDCPPSTGRLTSNALVAATHALLVTAPTPLALHGAQQVLDTVDVIRKLHRRQLRVAGVIVNNVPPTGREESLTLEAVSGAMSPVPVWAPAIPYRPVRNGRQTSEQAYEDALHRLLRLDPIYRRAHPGEDSTITGNGQQLSVTQIRE